MVFSCRLCSQKFDESVVRTWTAVGSSSNGWQLYSTGRYGLVHDLKKLKSDEEPQVPASDVDLSGVVTGILDEPQPQGEPIRYQARHLRRSTAKVR
jgi:hypothetical protein